MYTYTANNPLKYTDPSGYMTARELVGIMSNMYYGLRYGGSWSAGGGGSFVAFSSHEEALNTGIGLTNQNNAWGGTSYGSEEATREIFNFLGGLGSHYGDRRSLYCLNRPNILGNQGHHFEYDRTSGSFYIPGTNTIVNPFEYYNSSFGAQQEKDNSERDVWDPILLGTSFEFALPKIGKFPGIGVGFDIGFIADRRNGLGIYKTYKTPRAGEGGVAMSAVIEVSYARGKRGRNLDMFAIEGPGFSSSMGLVLIGGEIGSENNGYSYPSNYNQFSINLPGYSYGMDIGYTNWDTYTYVRPIFH